MLSYSLARKDLVVFSLEENSYWVDENYEVLPNAKATVILEV